MDGATGAGGARRTSTVTVAVCTRGRGDRITGTLRSVLASAVGDLEVLVVDQSDDDTTERAVAAVGDGRVRYLRTGTRGIGAGRRVAVEEATGDVVAFTDDDCVVPADWVTAMRDVLDDHPDVGMCFCNVVAAEHDPTAGFVPAYVRRGDLKAVTLRDKNRARGIGAGMAVRRATARAVGGFDPALGSRFAGVGNEEGDLALRMILAGHAVYETDRTAVVHDGFRTWEQGRDLARRNATGVGLAYAKPIRAGRWDAAVVVLHEGLVVALLQPLRELGRGRRPRLRSFWFFWRGFARGLRCPVDRDTLTFRAEHGA